jgi:hypothetical protein
VALPKMAHMLRLIKFHTGFLTQKAIFLFCGLMVRSHFSKLLKINSQENNHIWGGGNSVNLNTTRYHLTYKKKYWKKELLK